MQIILTTQYSPWSAYCGGCQRATHDLAKTFTQIGHQVTVIYTKVSWEKINIPDDIPYQLKWGNLYNTCSKKNDISRPLSAFSVANIAGQLISDNEDTIIHSYGEEGGRLHTLLKKHSFGLISTPQYPSYPKNLKNYDGMNVFEKATFWLQEGKYVMQAKTIRHAHFCSPPSCWAANRVQSILGLNSEKMQPVPNGVSAKFLAHKRSKSARTGPIIFFGRLAHDKGVDTLIKALDKIEKDKLPYIHIIGRGDMKPEFKEMVAKLSLSNKIIFKDWMSQNELAQELSHACMTVLPSRDENFSLAILSSLCVGSPTH